MKLNYIKNFGIAGDGNVKLIDEQKILFAQPDLPKTDLGMFNYWNEQKRGGYSDCAELRRLVLDYDSGITRAEIEDRFKDYAYICYNSSSNKIEHNKFRIILILKEPVDAYSLRYWRNRNSFKQMFDGIDLSSFSVGRFFYIPSKFDKDGNAVIVATHKGLPFDFYGLFPRRVKNEQFDDLVAKMKQSRRNYDAVENRLQILEKNSADKEYHYINAWGFIHFAQRLGCTEQESLEIFMNHYAGNTEMRKIWHRIWRNAEN